MGKVLKVVGIAGGIAVGISAGVSLVAANKFFDKTIVRKPANDPEFAARLASAPDVEDLVQENLARLNEFAEKTLATRTPELVSISSRDGLRLEADFYEPAPDTHRYVILAHAYASDRNGMRIFAAYYAERGYGVLMPDLRACGASEGKYMGMGWLDRIDLLDWIDLLIKRDPQAQIVLHGVSMGAAAVLMATGESLPSNVRVAIEDCGYLGVWDILSSELFHHYHTSEFPVLQLADFLCNLRAGYHFRDGSAVRLVANSKTPTLFIQGKDDDFVLYGSVHPMYGNCMADKELYLVKGAGHTRSVCVDPEAYFEHVFSFVDAHMD